MQRLGGWRALCWCVGGEGGEDDESRLPINMSSDSLEGTTTASHTALKVHVHVPMGLV